MRTKSSKGEVGQLATNKAVVLLSTLLFSTIALALVTFVHVSRQEAFDEEYLLRVSDQRILAQQVAKYSIAAAKGDSASFDQLQNTRDQFEKLLRELKKGVPSKGLPPMPEELNGELRAVENTWLELRQTADEILDNKESVLSIREYIGVISGLIPELQKANEEFLQQIIEKKASQEQIYYGAQQQTLAQRIANNVSRVLFGGQETAVAIDQFSIDADRLGFVLEALLNGNNDIRVKKITDATGREKLEQIALMFGAINEYAAKIMTAMPEVLPALEAANIANASSDKVNLSSTAVIEAFGDSPGRFAIAGIKASPVVVFVLGAVATVVFILLMTQFLANARVREAESKAKNEANQKAILRLLDEMGNLADGDLTVTATVTEDVTGAIADSINYAIEALRSLVTTINATSDKVSSAAQESRATAMHLAEASEHQAKQITSATESIKEMAQAVDEMSSDAKESAEVAQRSTEIAGKGAETVRRTIQGMDTIREQIQETAKRIKRLGESSQEIGDIVELIDDIADQTNILALNAAMQAAMAGEAGRGFAVVADEVQRLAERSSNATKQIEALVKTIQADTNEAVSSMENSTSGVVSGAKLAEDAGDALMEIENVSNYIADLTRKISDSAAKQSAGSASINDTMNVIQEITSQTADGTGQTAASIGTLADMADDLQKSVAGFRLPE